MFLIKQKRIKSRRERKERDRKMKKTILSTYTAKIIILNLLIFMLSVIFIAFFGGNFLGFLALQPSSILAGKNIWTIFTSIFLHISAWHLIANMVSLFFIGIFVEQLIGKKRFLIFYLASGLFAGLFYSLLSVLFGYTEMGARIFGSPDVLGLGASGAIFGLLGLMAVLTPRNRIYLIAGPLIAIVVQSVLGILFPSPEFLNIINILVSIYFVVSIFAIFSFNQSLRKLALPLEMPLWILPIVAIIPLVVIGLFVSLPIGNTAHLGGLIIGLLYGLYLRKKYPRKTAMISRYFSK